MSKDIRTKDNFSDKELNRRQKMMGLFDKNPIPSEEVLGNLGLFIPKTEFSRMLYLHELYQKQLAVPGVIMEFGVRWGQNMALYEAFRGIYEPFNWTRKIIGFDTFEGFPSVAKEDGDASIIAEGSYGVTENYQEYLQELLQLREQEGVQLEKARFQLVAGDASVTIKEYLQEHPETIISMAYFDFDIYQPTKDCLEAIKPYLTKGSVIAFDELNHPDFPGETVAVREVFGLDKYKLIHTTFSGARSYLVVE
ncbi:TylF/MycF/NovP-related O-methyltransferase [Sungkyunkwania multivorans]|uniref:TylF/MycF/NovP-related O-methyltransferase n=1 Tax=Sungkyunkwania multivorans TaxID=1173618 RepID=A0ABW3CSE8_9FLAO